MALDLLAILPSDGHGGCEYNALSALKYFRDKHSLNVGVAFPDAPATQYLIELCRSNDLPFETFAYRFDANDTLATCVQQEQVTHGLLARSKPSAVFLPLPWPKRGQGVIAGCAAYGVPTTVKFALVPPTYEKTDLVLPAARSAVSKRQVWFANSNFSARLIEQHWQLPPNSVDSFHVGPIGLAHLSKTNQAAEPAHLTRARVRSEFNVPHASRIAVTVARLSTQKGYDVLNDAAPALLAEHDDLVLLWVGHGELSEQMAAWIRENGFENRIKLAGFRDDVRRLLKASDVFVLPTIYEGGCSQALLEAMEEGLPIVVTDTSAVAEVARDNINALLVPPGNASKLAECTTRILRDRKFAASLAERARRDASAFSAERSFEHTLLRLRRAASATGIWRAMNGAKRVSPFLQLMSSSQDQIFYADDPAMDLGWYHCEHAPDGRAFRWMSDRARISTHVGIDCPTVLEVHGYSALTMPALQSMQAFVDDRQLKQLEPRVHERTHDWTVSWLIEPSPGPTKKLTVHLAAGHSSRPCELDNQSTDTRLLSVSVTGLQLRCMQ